MPDPQPEGTANMGKVGNEFRESFGWFLGGILGFIVAMLAVVAGIIVVGIILFNVFN